MILGVSQLQYNNAFWKAIKTVKEKKLGTFVTGLYRASVL